MKVILEITIFSQENKSGLTYIKQYETSCAPRIGDKVKDSLFAETKPVVDVIHELVSNQCTIILASKEVPNDRLNGHIQEVTAIHHWKLKVDQ